MFWYAYAAGIVTGVVGTVIGFLLYECSRLFVQWRSDINND